MNDSIFKGNTLSLGHRSSDFPRLECGSEHGGNACVCVRVCVSAPRGSPQSTAPVLMFSLGCITNGPDCHMCPETHRHTQKAAAATQRNAFKADDPSQPTVHYT